MKLDAADWKTTLLLVVLALIAVLILNALRLF